MSEVHLKRTLLKIRAMELLLYYKEYPWAEIHCYYIIYSNTYQMFEDVSAGVMYSLVGIKPSCACLSECEETCDTFI